MQVLRRWDRRRPGLVLIAGIVAMALLVRLPSFMHGIYNPDEAAIGVQAIAMRDGGRLYVDVADRKPPLPAVIYETVFRVTGSTDLRVLHVLAALFLAAGASVLALDARRRHGAVAGWVAAGLAVAGAIAFLPGDAQAANFAQFAFAPGAAAIVWCRRGGARWALLGGVALGLAVLCRQSWVYGIVAAMLAAALAGRRRDAAAVVAGTAGGISVAALVSPFSDFWRWSFTSNGSFATAAFEPDRTLGRLASSTSIFVAFHVAACALTVVAAACRWRHRRAWRDDADLWLWLLTGLAAVATGFHFFGHYWLQIVPVVVVIAVEALYAGPAPLAARLSARWWRLGVAAVVGSAIVGLVFGFVPGAFRDDPDPTELAAYVEQRTEPGEPVLVWGNFAEVLLLADRAPGGALVHSDFVTGRDGGDEVGAATLDQATPGAFDQMMDELREDPPALVLDTSTADVRGYGDYPLAMFPALDDFVDDHYRLVGRVDGVDVYAPVAR